jgi:transcriptional regulator NrdR family protein
MRRITKSSTDQDFQAFTTFDLTEKIESHMLELVKKMNEREKVDSQKITKLEQERRSKFNGEKLERKRALEN